MPAKSKNNYISAVGRRKTAVARVRLYKSASVPGVEGAQQLLVGNLPANEYFPGELSKGKYRAPFVVTGTLTKLSASVLVTGSGKEGQLGAVIHGLSRALIAHDPSLRPVLKSAGFLTRDSRAKERRKAGKGGKARRSKQSPKR